MKKALLLLFTFILLSTIKAQSKAGYYDFFRSSAKEEMKSYEKYLLRKDFKVISRTNDDDEDYTVKWQYSKDSFTAGATVHYEFLFDKLIVSMSEPYVILDSGLKFPLKENSNDKTEIQIYNVLKEILLEMVFKYVKIDEGKAKTATRLEEMKESAKVYQEITRKYTPNQTKEDAKILSQKYIDDFLSTIYQVKNLREKGEDWQEIEYTLDDKNRIITVDVYYYFKEKEVEMRIKNIKSYDKISKSTNYINRKDFQSENVIIYKTSERIFIDNHANFISPE